MLSFREEYQWPGLAAGYTDNDDFSGEAVGFDNLDRGDVPENQLNPTAIFGIGSCTKSMTATLLAKYLESGIIDWNMTLAQLFSVIEKIEQAHPSTFKKIKLSSPLQNLRLESLMTNTADMADSYPFLQNKYRASVEHFLENGSAKNSQSFSYSTFGFSVLSYISERLSGQRWDVQLKENLFEPLGMKNCFVQPGVFVPELNFGFALDMLTATGHFENIPEPLRGDNHLEPNNLAGGAAAFCSLQDWSKYLRFLAAGYKGEHDPHQKLIWRKEVFEKLFQQKGDHAYTYGAWQPSDEGFVYHFGGNGGFTVSAQVDLNTKEVIMVAANKSAYSSDFGSLYWLSQQIRAAVHRTQ